MKKIYKEDFSGVIVFLFFVACTIAYFSLYKMLGKQFTDLITSTVFVVCFSVIYIITILLD